jgi:hypothetical protein
VGADSALTGTFTVVSWSAEELVSHSIDGAAFSLVVRRAVFGIRPDSPVPSLVSLLPSSPMSATS